MEQLFVDLDARVSLQGMLGYLNFSSGKSDARFQKQVSEAYAFLTSKNSSAPQDRLHKALLWKLEHLRAEQAAAFRDATQVTRIVNVVFDQLLPAYLAHHEDLLAHQSEDDLLQPFFVARAFEAALQLAGANDEDAHLAAATVNQLNDYVGHRPIAILETRPRGEPYDHERVRPIPIYLHSAGVAAGRYHELLTLAMEILGRTDKNILAEACLDPQLLEEIAFDPRAYDHNHPANRRPNYVFGEWDPHHLDSQGRYRRYVARQLTLDALLDRVQQSQDQAEALFDAAAVFVGTMLMATGTSGASPATYDSSITLSTLMPRIAHYRDAYYTDLLRKVSGKRGERLRQESDHTRQPFGGARQHLNHFLARHRAAQVQQRQLASLFAEMGYPEASRKAAASIPVVSVRLLSEILGRITTSHLLADQGDFAQAVPLLAEAEDFLYRGIHCGAFVDPWNVLGFQGLFPLFQAREDSVRDPRVDELVDIVEKIFHLYSRLLSEAAAAGAGELMETMLVRMRQLATWWDQFAVVEVSEVRPVNGGEIVASAEHVSTALARWHEGGEKPADLGFWRDQLEKFQSPKAFALVVDALLRKSDYRAAMALLMNWLSHVDQVPLEDQEYSFHTLALRWTLGYTAMIGENDPPIVLNQVYVEERWPLLVKFFDYLEANAEEYWQVPSLDRDQSTIPEEGNGKEELYSAAYEDMTYKDSTGDDNEGSVLDGSEMLDDDFALEHQAEELSRRLKFLATVARLWQIAARFGRIPAEVKSNAAQERRATLESWLTTARDNQERLLALLDFLHEQQLPEPSGSYDSLVEYDRRRSLKEQLLYTAINTCLDAFMAVGTLEGVRASQEVRKPAPGRPTWEPLAIQLEQALLEGDEARARKLVPEFLRLFKAEPLLFTALADGGAPQSILRVRIAQAIVRALVTSLPRIGLIRETYELLRTARAMEVAHPPGGRSVTEFNHLFQAGYQAVVEAVVRSEPARTSTRTMDQDLVNLLELLARPFLLLWIEHSQSLQLSVLETINTDADWARVQQLIERYGHDIFHAKFMTLANLRSILHRGVGEYLDYLRDNPDPTQPVKLIEELDERISRQDAQNHLNLILQALIENYEEYKDYNTTTPHSDYGENLHLLLDFLRLKVQYERYAWRFRPLIMAHETLARSPRADFAPAWQEAFTRLTQALATQFEEKLAVLEKTHGMRLRTIADRVQERFVKPFLLDRLCALIEPAMQEARLAEGGKSFARLEQELRPLVATPTGVGLDVPHWLRRLEAEVQRVRNSQTSIGLLAEGVLGVPRKALSMEQLQDEIRPWAQEFSQS